jgi:hypothetical protein
MPDLAFGPHLDDLINDAVRHDPAYQVREHGKIKFRIPKLGDAKPVSGGTEAVTDISEFPRPVTYQANVTYQLRVTVQAPFGIFEQVSMPTPGHAVEQLLASLNYERANRPQGLVNIVAVRVEQIG